MIKEFIERLGVMNFILLLVVFITIIISEVLFLSGMQMEAIFLAFWPPTILAFMIYFKDRG